VPPETDEHGHRLFELATAAEQERAKFLDWLASVCGVRVSDLKGWTTLVAYDQLGRDAALEF